MIDGNDGGATITDRRRQDLDARRQPADRAVLPRHHRRPVPVPRLRRAAGQQHGRDRQLRRRRHDHRRATGTRSAARPAGSRPTRATPRSCTPTTSTRSIATTTARSSYQDISVAPEDMSGRGAADQRHRFQWTTPLIAPKYEPGVLYVGGEGVWRSTDDGATLDRDLGRPHAQRQVEAEAVGRADPARHHQRRVLRHGVRARRVAARARRCGRAPTTGWCGSRSDTGKRTGARSRRRACPSGARSTSIDPSPHVGGAAYLAVDRAPARRLQAVRVAHDGSRRDVDVDRGGPAGRRVRARGARGSGAARAAVRGTELGVFVSFDDGARWQPLQNNLPAHAGERPRRARRRPRDRDERPRVLDPRRHRAAARARRAPRARARGRRGAPVPPERAHRLYYDVFPDKRRPVGDNGPQGAVIDYWLAGEPKGDVTIEITDSAGAVVRRLTSAAPNRGPDQPPEWIDLVRTPDQLPKKAGANRFVWDLRWSEPTQIPGAFYEGLPPWGPIALPGRYTVKLTVAGKTRDRAARACQRPAQQGERRGPARVVRLAAEDARADRPAARRRSTRSARRARS